MIALEQLFSLDLWLTSGPVTRNGLIILVSLFSVLLLCGLISKILSTRQKDLFVVRLLNKIAMLSFTISGLGYVYSFFAYQGVLILSLRFWVLIIGILAIMWVLRIWKYWTKFVPAQKRKMASQLVKERYL